MSSIHIIVLSSGLFLATVYLYIWLHLRTVEVGFQVAFGILWETKLSRAERMRRLTTNWTVYQAAQWVVALTTGLALLEIAKEASGTVQIVYLYAYLLLLIGVATLVTGFFDRRQLAKRIRAGQYGFVDPDA